MIWSPGCRPVSGRAGWNRAGWGALRRGGCGVAELAHWGRSPNKLKRKRIPWHLPQVQTSPSGGFPPASLPRAGRKHPGDSREWPSTYDHDTRLFLSLKPCKPILEKNASCQRAAAGHARQGRQHIEEVAGVAPLPLVVGRGAHPGEKRRRFPIIKQVEHHRRAGALAVVLMRRPRPVIPVRDPPLLTQTAGFSRMKSSRFYAFCDWTVFMDYWCFASAAPGSFLNSTMASANALPICAMILEDPR